MDWSKFIESLHGVLARITSQKNPNKRYINGRTAEINQSGDTIVTTPLGLNGQRVTTLHYPNWSSITTYESNSGEVRDNQIEVSDSAAVEKDRQFAKKAFSKKLGGTIDYLKFYK